MGVATKPTLEERLRWMETHDASEVISVPSPRRAKHPRRRCKAKSSRTGQRCRAWAVKGGTVCTAHGGRAKQVRNKAQQRMHEQAVQHAMERGRLALGGSMDVHPLEALLSQVHEAAANVQAYRMYIEGLGVKVDCHGAVAVPEQIIEFDRGGTHVPAGEHVMVKMYNAERERLVKFSKMCLDAGVDERQVRMAEFQGQALAKVLDVGITAAATGGVEAGRKAAAEAMREIAAGAYKLGSDGETDL